MSTILDKIVAEKRQSIALLYQQHDLEVLRRQVQPTTRSFYQKLAAARAAQEAFFIAEFKRKSPSEGWINQHTEPIAQVRAYARAGAKAVSILTDEAFFGGSYADLLRVAQAIPEGERPLLLQKDFILDPIQIYLARQAGADLILLIAAILQPDEMQALRQTAESLGMGVLAEVHDAEELEKILPLNFPVIGVNNRDLKTFRTALNRFNYLNDKYLPQQDRPLLVAESGVGDYRDFQCVRRADAFLIGTGLMRQEQAPTSFSSYFRTDKPYLFKACGIRSADMLHPNEADFIGLNFSPRSKRRIDPAILEKQPLPENAVAVFYQNTEAEILETLARFSFKRIQLYAGDVSLGFIKKLRVRVFLAAALKQEADLQQLDQYAPHVDAFILDGALPGSGQASAVEIPANFPYPFFLAGGMHSGNLERLLPFENCIGVDMASGIEDTDGSVRLEKIQQVAVKLKNLVPESLKTIDL